MCAALDTHVGAINYCECCRWAVGTLVSSTSRKVRADFECGDLAHGFLRIRCEDCAHERVVALSCQLFCPSCMGRRMADTAARLIDEVLPPVPVIPPPHPG